MEEEGRETVCPAIESRPDEAIPARESGSPATGSCLDGRFREFSRPILRIDHDEEPLPGFHRRGSRTARCGFVQRQKASTFPKASSRKWLECR